MHAEDAQALVDKLQELPPERQAEVEDFIDFLRQRTLLEPLRRLLRLLTVTPTGGKQIHDANIVATMMAYNIPVLLTFNRRDFERFGQYVTLDVTD